MAPAGRGQTRFVQSETAADGTVPAEHYSRAGRAVKSLRGSHAEAVCGRDKAGTQRLPKEKRGAGDFPYNKDKDEFPPEEGGKRWRGHRRSSGRPNALTPRHEEDGCRQPRRTDGYSSGEKPEDEPDRKD